MQRCILLSMLCQSFINASKLKFDIMPFTDIHYTDIKSSMFFKGDFKDTSFVRMQNKMNGKKTEHKETIRSDSSTSDTGTFPGSKWTLSIFCFCATVTGRRNSNTCATMGEPQRIFFMSPNMERSLMSMITWVSVTLNGCIISILPPVKCATAKPSLFFSEKYI